MGREREDLSCRGVEASGFGVFGHILFTLVFFASDSPLLFGEVEVTQTPALQKTQAITRYHPGTP